MALASGVVVFPAGCGNKDTACVPGQSIACAGAQSCASAFQVCKSDGSGYGGCQCGGDGGPTAFPPYGPNSGRIGASCNSDDDCRQKLTCLTTGASMVGSEGPSSGLCTAACHPDHDFCNTYDARAKCIVTDDGGTPADTSDDSGYCMLGCKIADTKDPDKCRIRDDLVCFEDVIGSGIGYCKPACRKDSDCTPRFCDIGTGLCGDAPRTGEQIGLLCDPLNDTCAGACLPLAGGYTECSGICSYGNPGACGQTRTDPPYDFYCYTEDAQGSGAGDLGHCARACNCDSDCGRIDAVCEPHPELVGKTGRSGICGSKALSNGTLRPNLPCK